ncbi:hypothetical protein CAL14_08625 [Bordetella genomosp. 9]|uniref:phosphatidylinositol-specific phospholipase C domain-containing protein n=1 Tax=Bordetella genomosp. 9 TaxID=1416803 RepID=UPI000A297B9D|nr:phosphatidylinositol-specific phospholipase C domain-containing protein [Bordetella genomosp. 9]ARP90346.1 hypothetical protein CAL14_08625 [Bordetella genomosp. 9]
MSAREVHVWFYNCTHVPLQLISKSLSHGEWEVKPPDVVYPGDTAYWRSDSDGFLTGTEGKAHYSTPDGMSIELWWDNPYVGYDKNGIYFDGNAWFANDYTYYGGYQTQRGDDENVTFTLCEAAPDWMQKFWLFSNENYKNTRLRDLMIPGTHDSATYGINPYSQLAPDATKEIREAFPFFPEVVVYWAIAQDLNITQQLHAGIRYFDLRVAWRDDDDQLWICHSLYSVKVSEVLDAVADFIYAYPNEIIFLDFNHFYAMSREQHDNLARMIREKLGGRLVPSSAGNDVTPQNIWDAEKQIIVDYHYDDVDFQYQNSDFWFYRITSNWPDTDDIETLKEKLSKELSDYHSQFWVMQCILTGKEWISLAWKHEFGGYPRSLIEWASGTTNNDMLPTIGSRAWQGRVNIVMCDAFEHSRGFVETIISQYYKSGRGALVGLEVCVDGTFKAELDDGRTLDGMYDVRGAVGSAVYRSLLSAIRHKKMLVFRLSSKGKIKGFLDVVDSSLG